MDGTQKDCFTDPGDASPDDGLEWCAIRELFCGFLSVEIHS